MVSVRHFSLLYFVWTRRLDTAAPFTISSTQWLQLRQWEDLYTATGIRVASVISLQDNFGTSIVEGLKA